MRAFRTCVVVAASSRMLAIVALRRRSAAVVARTSATLLQLAGRCVWKCVRQASRPTCLRYASTSEGMYDDDVESLPSDASDALSDGDDDARWEARYGGSLGLAGGDGGDDGDGFGDGFGVDGFGSSTIVIDYGRAQKRPREEEEDGDEEE